MPKDDSPQPYRDFENTKEITKQASQSTWTYYEDQTVKSDAQNRLISDTHTTNTVVPKKVENE